MAWTNTTDKNTGYLVTAGDYNILQDNLDYLKGTTAQELFISPQYPISNAWIDSDMTSWGILLSSTAASNVFFNFKVPDDFVSFSKVELIWRNWAASTSEQMYWGMSGVYAHEGENMVIGAASSNHYDNPGSTYQSVPATNGIVIVNEPTLPLTLSNLAIGDYIGVRVTRGGTEANDDTGAAMVLGMLFTYTGRFTST